VIETVSPTDENLILLNGVESFYKHALGCAEKSQRELVVLSQQLDPLLYNHDNFADAVSKMVRSDRHSRVRILVKDPRPVIESGHRLLTLSRRLSSKIEIRKLLIEPKDETVGYLIGDKKYLLYQHTETQYSGFINYNGAPESKKLLEEFDYLWDQHGFVDPEFRQLMI